MWAAAISLFFNRWGKIRLMEPYQVISSFPNNIIKAFNLSNEKYLEKPMITTFFKPHFERERPIPRTANGPHHPDRRHSLMQLQTLDETQYQKRLTKTKSYNFQ
jgi:hypothetical protein